MVLTVFQVIAEAHESSGVPASEIAQAQRIIPPGACVATDQASYTIAINRFVSTVPGCSLMIDGVGTDYALSNGRNGETGAGSSPAVAAAWMASSGTPRTPGSPPRSTAGFRGPRSCGPTSTATSCR